MRPGAGRLFSPGSAANARLVYITYLLAPFLFMALAPAGFIIACLGAREGRSGADTLVLGHYRNQIGIFWKMATYMIVALLLAHILVGVLICVLALAWYMLRALHGLRALSAGEPPANPESWLF